MTEHEQQRHVDHRERPDVERFLELERVVWQALVDGDPEADAAALSNDFLGVYPSGFAGRDAHAAQLFDGPTVVSYSLSEARLLTVSETAVMLAYRADFTRPGTTGGSSAMYVSSLWCRREGRWINVFSQDTPVTRR